MKKEKIRTGLFGLLLEYQWAIVALALVTIAMSVLSLVLPKVIATSIDLYNKGTFVIGVALFQFSTVILGVFIFTSVQSILQTYVSERVARDIRKKLSDKISRESYAFVGKITPAKLLTNLTSDVDSVKMFISLAVVSLISSFVLVIGAVFFLVTINWRLAIVVLSIIPIIFWLFYFIFGEARSLFKRRSEIIDWLNKVINESILGSSLIRVLHSEQSECAKFIAANIEAKNIGLQVLMKFAILIPSATFVANLAAVAILSLGGHFVISGVMTLGDFMAFNSYVALLIFPILMIGFISNFIAQASASYGRISEVLLKEEKEKQGTLVSVLRGQVECKNIFLSYGEKPVLKNISFSLSPKSKTAIIGPTAGGKTELLSALIGLVVPDSGTIEYDGHRLGEYDKEAFHRQIGFVFQDSIIFNMTIRENIEWGSFGSNTDFEKAVETAELLDFLSVLPDGLETVISERGGSISGGQKQRIMLARALTLRPKILFLDDFTARVDQKTERKILENIAKNYPDLTLVSVTQKISSVEKYDQIIVMMEGEILALGKHEELLKTSPEYAQIYQSQKSTNSYE